MCDAKSEDIREAHLRNADFLGAFALIEHSDELLMVQNQRIIQGRSRLVWDLPGGQVEPGERLTEALCRELREELVIEVVGAPEFLFFQEGTRTDDGERRYIWRSFFFAVHEFTGEPRASSEVKGFEWIARNDLATRLDAPYHDSFKLWLRKGGKTFDSIWAE